MRRLSFCVQNNFQNRSRNTASQGNLEEKEEEMRLRSRKAVREFLDELKELKKNPSKLDVELIIAHGREVGIDLNEKSLESAQVRLDSQIEMLEWFLGLRKKPGRFARPRR
jgi:hypothetical protein